MSNEFQGQVAIITGGASGLGFAVTKSLEERGAKVVVLDKNPDALKKVKEKWNADVFTIDVREEDAIRDAIETIGQRYGRIDILINSAGITGNTNIKSHETSSDNIRLVFDINFMGSYYSSKHVLPWMLKNHYGRILHIASIAGKEGNAGMLAYSASKAALINMAKVQAKEYAETGITINALAPAVIKTDLVEQMPPEQVKYMTDKIPMKRYGTLDEFASMALYIVSSANSFTTGFTFDLSGGRATY
jgi:2-dehydro-3-deoxy-L-rhamnonate dehydrogenase (NAD+)